MSCCALVSGCVRSPSEMYQKATDYKFMGKAVWEGAVNASYYGLIAYYLSGRGKGCARIPKESPKYAAVFYGAVPVISSIACSVILKSGYALVMENVYLGFRSELSILDESSCKLFSTINNRLFQKAKIDEEIAEFREEWKISKTWAVVKTFTPLSVNIVAFSTFTYFLTNHLQKRFFADVKIKGSWGLVNSVLANVPWCLSGVFLGKVVLGKDYQKYKKLGLQVSTVALATYIFRKNIFSVLSSLQKVSVYARSTNR